jgi:hypothetical protein
MNKYKKVLSFVLALFFVQINAFAVTIQENAPKPQQEVSNGLTDVVVGAVVMGLALGVVIGIIIFIIWFIVNKIKEAKRRHSDLLYTKFMIEVQKCHQNRDSRLKSRNWKTLFFTFKRADIYLQTKEEGLKLFGKYDGEVVIKDAFLLLAVYRVTGIFSREKDIIIIPYELRKLIRKEKHGKFYELIIDAESVDEALNTDYYNQLVVKDHKNNDKLINFNEYIQKNFMDNYVYRQVIKDQLLDFKASMDKAVEMNPNIQVERKNPKQ